jgi:PKD repeat protein
MYYVTVFGQYGCSRSDSTYVTINTALTGPTVSLNQSALDFCQGAVTLPILLVASSSAIGSTFSWKNANGNPVSTNDTLTINTLNQSITYSVTVTDPVNGCTSSASSVLSIHAYANAAFTNVVGASYAVTFTNFSTGASAYTWNFGDGSPTSNVQNPTHSYAVAGSYTVTLIATNASGCNDTLSQITLVTSPLDPPLGGTVSASLEMICGGSGITNLSLNNASTGNGVTYAWYVGTSQNGTYTATGATSLNITTDTLYNDTYFYCVVTNANGSTNSDTILIHVNQSPLPIISISSALDTICRNDILTLTAQGASTYLWSTTTNQNYSTLSSIDVAPQNTSMYTLVGTDVNGCQSLPVSKTIVVGRRPTINSITSSIDTVCHGGSASLNVSAFTGAAGVQLTYLWNPTASTSQSIVVSPSATTMYTVTVYGQYGCFRKDSIQVVLNSSLVGPSVSVNNPSLEFCQGTTSPVVLIASSSLSGATFTWTNANGSTVSTSDSLTVTNFFQSTTYAVSVTDPSNGCTSSASSVISIHPNAIASFTNFIGVNYDVTFTNTSTNATSYIWNFGDGATSSAQNPSHTYSGPASYTVMLIASNANGCNDTTSQTIIVTSPLDPPVGGSVISSSATICGGSGTTNLTLTNSSTGNGIAYTWYASTNSSGNSFTSFGNSSTMVTSNTLTQPTYFYCTVTNSNGSTNSDTLLVAVNTNPLPIVSITSLTDTICSNDTITLTANGAATYLWSTGNNPNLSTQSSISISPNNMTTYTLVGTDNSGCSSLPVTKTIVVGMNPTITNIANSDTTICSGGSSTLSVTAFAGGGSQLTYDWSTGESTQSITVSPSTTTLYIVTVSGLYGCSSSDTTTVTMNSGQVGPTVTVDQPMIELCQGATSQITVVATSSVSGSIFTWINANGNTVSTTETLTVNAPNQNTTYTVQVTDPSNGCVSSVSSMVNINPVPTANLTTSNATVCANGSTVIDLTIGNTGGQSTSAYAINWTPGTLTGSSVTVSPTATTTYSVSVTSPFGCTQSNSLTITVDPMLVGAIVSISPSDTIQCQSNLSPVMLVVNSNDPLLTYTWFPQSVISTNDSILVNPLTTTIYTVSATNQVGCVSSASATVVIEQNPVASFSYTNSASNSASFNTSTIGATYLWSFGDGATSELQNPQHTYAASGTYNVTLVVTNSSGCSDTIVQSVVVSNVSVEEIFGIQGIVVYPNPTNGLLKVKFDLEHTALKIVVMNLLGDIIYEKSLLDIGNSNVDQIIDISEFSKGIYVIQVTCDSNQRYTQRVIKQ